MVYRALFPESVAFGAFFIRLDSGILRKIMNRKIQALMDAGVQVDDPASLWVDQDVEIGRAHV